MAADFGGGAWSALPNAGNSLLQAYMLAKKANLEQQMGQSKMDLEKAQASAVKPSMISGKLVKQLGLGRDDLEENAEVPVAALSPSMHLQGTEETNDMRKQLADAQNEIKRLGLELKAGGKGGFANKYSGGGGEGTTNDPKEKEMLDKVVSATGMFRDYLNNYLNSGLNTTGAALSNFMAEHTPSSLSGLTAKRNPALAGLRQQLELLTDQFTPIAAGNNRPSFQLRDAIRKNAMIQPGTPTDAVFQQMAPNFFKDLKYRAFANHAPQSVVDTLDELSSAQSPEELDAIYQRHGGLQVKRTGEPSPQTLAGEQHPPLSGMPPLNSGSQSVHPPQIIEKAKAALSDPNAPAEVKAKAQAILSGQ